MAELPVALTLLALMAATLEYAIVIRHREERRNAVQWQADVQESLVWVGRTDPRPARRWSDDGSRFRVDR